MHDYIHIVKTFPNRSAIKELHEISYAHTRKLRLEITKKPSITERFCQDSKETDHTIACYLLTVSLG